jgi:glucose-6-phosphate 1-epimerase
MKPNVEDLVELRSEDGAGATIHLQGAHILSWFPACGKQQLYLSKAAIFAPNTPIRGGVPICFPQFSSLGSLPKHGFARTSRWTLVKQRQGQGVFMLRDTPETRALWPHAFELELEINLQGQELLLWLTVKNTGNSAFDFMAALHTYLAVSEVTGVEATGLRGLTFTDDVTNTEHADSSASISFGTDIDRLYHEAEPQTVRVGVHEVNQEGFRDTVVWNPGPATGSKISDLDQPDGWRKFVCVEAAQVIKPMHLEAGESWRGGQQLIAG